MADSLVEEIRSRLAALAPEALDIHDDSAAHAGHAGAASGGGHFDVLIVADAFAGLNSLARHRKVYALLGELMPHRIHALSLKALTPDEL
ncbi:BolA family transcriptional regulator [Jeongeupia sp. HS-3]|uniref:BolA family protein n=1 Tax=Jeongeupia sp. HS-3 TaxID=1009682 RepID=UPI0018A4C199|nr:BolA family protein [Jeongeupia sp. HS-3]BCL75519.1 BolA family transcriptional regulator [Jeongeupia sp. HS-3]